MVLLARISMLECEERHKLLEKLADDLEVGQFGDSMRQKDFERLIEATGKAATKATHELIRKGGAT